MKKRLLASLLSLAMVLTLLPTAALAEEPAPETETGVVQGEKGSYASIAAALAAGEDSVTLTGDLQEDVVIDEDERLTLNLGGHELSEASGHTISNKGILVIEGTGTAKNTIASVGALANYPGGEVALNGGTFENTGWYTIKNLGTMTINEGVEVKTSDAGSSLIDTGWYGNQGNDLGLEYEPDSEVTLTINGGTFTGGMNTIKNDDYGVLLIKDGTFKNEQGAVVLNWNEATIEGGSFTGNTGSSPVIANSYLSDTADKGQMTITGGTFTAPENSALFGYGEGSKDGGTTAIEGGTFHGTIGSNLPYELDITGGTYDDKDGVQEYLPDGYITDESGAVIPATAPGEDSVASVTQNGVTQYFDTLSGAIAIAQDGDTVTLLKEVSLDAPIEISAGITLDLNQQTVISTGQEGAFIVTSGDQNVTFENGSIVNNSNSTGSRVMFLQNGTATLDDVKVTSYDYGIYVGSWTDSSYGNLIVRGTETEIKTTLEGNATAIVVSGTTGQKSILTIEDGQISSYAFPVSGQGGGTANNTEINISGGSLTSTLGPAIYHPQVGVLNVTGGTISGCTGIEMRAGTLNISGNPTITATATKFASSSNPSGNTTDGAAIAVVQHTTKQEISVDITGGTFSGIVPFYEEDLENNGEDGTSKIDVAIRGGTFTKISGEGADGKGAVYSETQTDFISGGTFSTDVSEYCAPGLIAESNGDGAFSITTDSNMTVQVQSADGAVKGAYSSLADAVTNAASGDTLVLLANQVTDAITIEPGKELTLDLAGHLIIPNNASIIVKGGLTVKDSSENGKGEIQTSRQIEVDGGSFTLESGKLSFIGLNSSMYIHSDGTAIVNGGEITGTYSPLSGNNTTGDMNVEINGGTITAENGAAIYMPSQGELTITGGTLNGGVSLRMGEVNISGGTINATTSSIDDPSEYYSYSGNVFFPDALYVLNGTYTSGDDNSLSLNITGGTFNCANGEGSAVAIYDLGKVEQESEVQISKDAVLVTNASDRDAYQVLGFDDIGVETPDEGYGKDTLIGQVDTAISGGSFSTQIKEEYCAKDFVPVTTKDDNGMYTVTEKVESGETVTGLTLEPKSLTLTDGETYQLKAGTTPPDTSLTWTSSNPSVATVNDSGRVTAVGAGTATIKVEAGQLSLTCKVTVKAAPSSSSGSSSSDPSYSPKLDISDGGSVKINPRTPEEDDKVTITPEPDRGYEVSSVIVTDRSGDEVRVTANRDGTYTFTQPRGRVTIEITFVRTGESVFFDDVPESFWAYDEIKWAYENGYVNGTTTTTFSPNASISRQQVWMILARLSGADPANMAAAREWAMVNDISDGTNPGSAVTRQQLVALLYRYAVMMGYANDARADLTTFPDAGTVAAYAVEPMQWSVANNIVAGTSAGTLNPTGTATRAQFAVILYRFMA